MTMIKYLGDEGKVWLTYLHICILDYFRIPLPCLLYTHTATLFYLNHMIWGTVLAGKRFKIRTVPENPAHMVGGLFLLRYNSSVKKIHLLKVYNSAVFRIFIRVVEPPPVSNFRTFSSLSKESSVVVPHALSLPAPSSHQSTFCLCRLAYSGLCI